MNVIVACQHTTGIDINNTDNNPASNIPVTFWSPVIILLGGVLAVDAVFVSICQ